MNTIVSPNTMRVWCICTVTCGSHVLSASSSRASDCSMYVLTSMPSDMTIISTPAHASHAMFFLGNTLPRRTLI